MEALTERLEIRVSHRTLRLVREEARTRGVSVGQLIREAIDREVDDGMADRLRAAEALFAIAAPVGDWPQMEREIEQARAGDA